MGLNIGNIGASLSGLRSLPQFGQVRLPAASTAAPPLGSSQDDGAPGPFFKERDEAPLRAGFGRGSLSPQGAALLTINRTTEQVRENTPTIEDIRARFREARSAEDADETRRARFERDDAGDARRIQTRIPAAAAQARNFISEINQTIVDTQARLRGEESGGATGGPTIQIGGESFAFGIADPGSRLDVRV